MNLPGTCTEEQKDLAGRGLRAGLGYAQVAFLIGITEECWRKWSIKSPEWKQWIRQQKAIGELHHAEVISEGGIGKNGEAGGAGARVAASKFYLSTRPHRNWVPAAEVAHSGAVSLTDLMDASPEQSTDDEGDGLEDEGSET